MTIRRQWSAPAQPEQVGRLRAEVAKFAAAGGASGVQLGDLRSCVSEAVTNAVVHAFRDGRPAGAVAVAAELADGELTVTVSDDGMGFMPRADSPGIGLGLPTITTLCSSMTIGPSSDGGTEVSMTFVLERELAGVSSGSR